MLLDYVVKVVDLYILLSRQDVDCRGICLSCFQLIISLQQAQCWRAQMLAPLSSISITLQVAPRAAHFRHKNVIILEFFVTKM